jgi:hypothetical protein
MGLLYEKGGSSPYETIIFARFNEAWLDVPPPPAENPGAAFWSIEETVVGQTNSTAADAIIDVHPDGNDLHLTAATAFPVIAGAPAFGNGRAISLTGNGGARILDSAATNRFDYGPNDSFTIEVVCRIPSGSTQVGALVAKDVGPTTPSWWLRVENGKARFLISDNATERVFYSTANINTGEWHHVAAVRDATDPANKQLRLYIDGHPSGTLADTTTGTLANGNALWIGRFNSGSRLLTGDIDLVRITPAALSPEQFVTRTTQFDADADGIPDEFERTQSGSLDTWNATHLSAFAFSGQPGFVPPTTLAIEGGEIVLTRTLRELPFWLDSSLTGSTDLVRWDPVPSVTTLDPLGNGQISRTDRLLLDSNSTQAFFRHEIVRTSP